MSEMVVPDGWEVKSLSQLVGKITSGGTPKVGNKKFYGGDIPFLKIDDLTSSNKVVEKLQKQTIPLCQASVASNF
jgi:hypothetical protein